IIGRDLTESRCPLVIASEPAECLLKVRLRGRPVRAGERLPGLVRSQQHLYDLIKLMCVPQPLLKLGGEQLRVARGKPQIPVRVRVAGNADADNVGAPSSMAWQWGRV